jgi:succinate-semialdehyde dehydrogenase/glutarate-semialdehyde dehydrogenase
MALCSMNPATGAVLKRFSKATRADIGRGLDAAQRAFRTWRERPFHERGARMHRAAAILRERAQSYARLATLEMGKPIMQSVAEIEKCAWVCDFYADQAAQFLADESVATEARRSVVHYEPLGPVLAVMPWNFPFWQVFRFAAPGLMAGNVGLLKHASNVPQCARVIETLFRDAGFPKGCFQTLLIPSDAVDSIIADDRVAAVTLTGSEPAGVQVASAAGRALKKVVLELGGSDPFVVLRDADLARCCAVAAQARVINSGQSCIAAKRFIVERAVAKPFTDGFVAQMRALRVGDPLDEATQVGPLARGDLLDELERQVQGSVRRGARLLTGGRRLRGPGFFFEVTVLDHVRPGMPAYDEEVFGPVASIIVARDEAEATRLANESRFGLAASVWGADIDRCHAVARRLETGTVYINDMVRSDPRLPFGGIKKSGFGRELGAHGIREFTNVKAVVAP